MITLCMDTSQTFLVLALLKEDKVLASVQETCWKRQSEELFPQLIRMMEDNGVKTEDISEIVITSGPGSYTGVRIAMTVAKVFAAMKEVPLYTLGSLQLIAGRERHVHVLMDARGHRAYHAVYNSGKAVLEPQAADTDDLRNSIPETETVLGEGHLIGREDCWPDLAQNFLQLKPEWKPIENVHLLTPDYLKPAEAYLVKK